MWYYVLEMPINFNHSEVITLEISIESHIYYSINIGGKSIPFITDAVITMCIITAVIVLFVVLATKKLKKVPTGLQKPAEMLVDFINNLSKEQIGRHFKAFAPMVCTFLLFIAISNLAAIFNVIPSGKVLGKILPSLKDFEFSIHPPTKNFNVTVCLALSVMVIVIITEFRYKGPRNWIKGFYKPNPIFGFVKILDYFVRPLSLCLRLFGNVLGGYIAMSLLYTAIPLVLPAFVSMYFDLFDGILQAYVFIFLTTMYLSEASENEVEESEVKESIGEVN